MKIAVFSDIHGNYQALSAILSSIKSKNVDTTIFLGDAIALGPDSTLCLKLLNKTDVIQLMGNHEYYCIYGTDNDPYFSEKNISHEKYINKLRILPNLKENILRYDINIYGKKLSFCHFILSNDVYPFYTLDILKDNTYKKIFKNIDSDYVFFGHEHRQKFYEVNNKKFYCVGSSGCVKGEYTYYYLIDISKDRVKINKIKIKYDRKKLIHSFNNKSYPQKEDIAKKIFGIKEYQLRTKKH